MTLEDGYRNWLAEQGYAASTIRDEISQLRRLERYFGPIAPLGQHGREALIAQLTYSVEDERRGRSNPTPLPIMGNLRTNLATYKKTVRLYARFLQSIAKDTA